MLKRQVDDAGKGDMSSKSDSNSMSDVVATGIIIIITLIAIITIIISNSEGRTPKHKQDFENRRAGRETRRVETGGPLTFCSRGRKGRCTMVLSRVASSWVLEFGRVVV